MKITVVGSMTFLKQMQEVRKKLRELGHDVILPIEEDDPFHQDLGQILEEKIKLKQEAMFKHAENIDSSDAILVLNYDKNAVKNYIGGNSFAEMHQAFVSRKKIFLWNPFPDINYKDEIITMEPIVINGNLEEIR